MVHTTRRDPRKDASKAGAIALSGQSIFLEGDPRHLRKVRDLLADVDVKTFLGNDADEVVLWVGPKDVFGSIVWEKRQAL